MNDHELTLAGVDVQDLYRRLMQNTALVKMLIRKFTEDRTFAALEAAVATGDAAGIESASHTLKGMCGNMSLKELFGLFHSQVQLVRSGKSGEAAAMMEQIGPKFRDAIFHMQTWLSRQ